MLLSARQCVLGFALDRCRKDCDVLAFPSGCDSCQLTRQRCHGPRFGDLHVQLMDARSRDVRKREAGVFADCFIESLLAAAPGGKQQLNTVAVKRCRAIRSGGKRKTIPIPIQVPLPHQNQRRTNVAASNHISTQAATRGCIMPICV
ncbi:MAG: hypothetical protein E6G79_24020 [Alphaproteobacteria bacterium]|nr:MAG: hypothetical protein E6G79_24020 [Alphaproteobacteria bacterium]